MRIEIGSLTPALAVRVHEAMDAARSATLPARLPWPAGTKVDDLGKGDSPMCRFSDGMFHAIFPGGAEWNGDGGTGWDMTGCTVHWTPEIDADTGDITAVPRVADFKVTRGGTASEMAAALGATPQRIGTLGPLTPFFSDLDAAAQAFDAIGLKRPTQTYVPAAEAPALREALLSALR